MKYTCATCGATMEAPGRYVIMSRGHYWHLPCATLQSGEVGFPSSGKLLPVSILRTEPEPTPMQTHYAECWRDPEHHACAVAEIERLQAQVHARDGIIVDLSTWLNGVLAVLDRSDIPAEVHAELARLRRENEEGNA